MGGQHAISIADNKISKISLGTEFVYVILLMPNVFIISFLSLFTFSVVIYLNIALFVCWSDDVIKWKHFPRHWPFVRRIHRSPVNSLHKGQ